MKATKPMIIQGGMGVAVSSWQLARAVGASGQLGVVSGTALDIVLTRRLQLGDPTGVYRRAIEEFPFPEMGRRVIDRYFVPGGKAPDKPFRDLHLPGQRLDLDRVELLLVANFVEVFLAKDGHHGSIGINFLEKIQTTLLPSLFGAMLARVDYVLMGAGIPRAIPGVLDRLSQGQSCELKLDVTAGSPVVDSRLQFDPVEHCGSDLPWVERPRFLAIVSSDTLATMLTRKSTGHVDGFVVENHSAGGHNAPPRGPKRVNDRGEPMYGERDESDLSVFRGLERPFWLAGSFGSPSGLRRARDAGAAGVQVGTVFAFCDESGLRSDLKAQVLQQVRQNAIDVFTDPLASPTGFPFKVLRLPGTLSDPALSTVRRRRCDLGYLRHAYCRADGEIGWRCPAEDVAVYVRKGGSQEDTVGRHCLCNALLANVGLGQIRADGTSEWPLLTSGDDFQAIFGIMETLRTSHYTARDVIDYLLGGPDETARPEEITTAVPVQLIDI
ncbi:MAG: nitronate monooxygenase [Pirellulales bacterium]